MNAVRPRAWSLVGRLTWGVALIALLSFAAQAVVLALWLKPAVDDLINMAAEQAVTVRAALQAMPAGQRQALAARLSGDTVTLSTRPPPGATDERVDARVPGPLGLPGMRPGERDLQQARGDVEVRRQPLADGNQAIVFRLPVDNQVWWLSRIVGPPDGALSGTLVVWLLLLAGATVSALLLSVRLIARPFGQLARQLSLQQGRLQPLPEPGDASAELQALVQAFNQLAHQVTATAQQRQQLLAGVSHDLRTPLARLRLRAETQCEPPLADALGTDLHALERIADQFLAYVHSDSDMPLGVPAPLVHSVADAVQPYVNAGQDLRLLLEPVQLPVPDLAVQRLLTNLIDNALAYGQLPVVVALRAVGDGAELLVGDHGPGMSDDDFERAQQPFVRLTRARSELGHCGLGLAIVAQIARQLGATLQARHQPAGLAPAADAGFAIVLQLPPAGSA